MVKKIFRVVLVMAAFAIGFWQWHANFQEVPLVEANNLQGCANGETCISGTICNNTVCCPAGYCGWGDNVYFARECVANGGIRENSWAKLVCRNGVWKVPDNGWGCNSTWACETGTCYTEGNISMCRSCTMDPGPYKNCSKGEACPAGTSCNNTICCPAGTCGYGGLPYFTNQCAGEGEIRENRWGKSICRHGVWYTPLNGWGCSGSWTVGCESGTCQKIGGEDYCVASLPITANYSASINDTGAYCQGSCRTCASMGYKCGNINDNCGSTINCGSCAPGETCSSGTCVATTDIPICNSRENALGVSGTCVATGDVPPQISEIKISNGAEEDYIDVGDTIEIVFNEAIDPESINSGFDKGDYVTGISYSKTGGVSVSSKGEVAIKNIAAFDAGSVADSGNFTVKLALSSSGKILTITLTGGTNIEVIDENFGETRQIGGTVKDLNGNKMENDSSIDEPTGGFGEGDGGNEGESNSNLTALYAQIDALKAEIAALQKQLAAVLGGKGSAGDSSGYGCNQLTKYLYYETTDPEVTCLQNF